jgi:hypothetical protein
MMRIERVGNAHAFSLLLTGVVSTEIVINWCG